MPTADQIGAIAVRGMGDINPTLYGYPSFQAMAADCANWKNWLIHSACWGYGPSAWGEMGQLPTPSAPPHVPAVDMGSSTLPAPYVDSAAYNAAINDAIAVSKEQYNQQNDAFFGTVPMLLDGSNTPGPNGGTSIPTWLIVAGVAVGVLLISRR